MIDPSFGPAARAMWYLQHWRYYWMDDQSLCLNLQPETEGEGKPMVFNINPEHDIVYLRDMTWDDDRKVEIFEWESRNTMTFYRIDTGGYRSSIELGGNVWRLTGARITPHPVHIEDIG